MRKGDEMASTDVKRSRSIKVKLPLFEWEEKMEWVEKGKVLDASQHKLKLETSMPITDLISDVKVRGGTPPVLSVRSGGDVSVFQNFEQKESSSPDVRPHVLLAGEIDAPYIETAAKLLGRMDTLKKVKLFPIGTCRQGVGSLGTGDSNLWKISMVVNSISQTISSKYMALFDCDYGKNIQKINEISWSKNITVFIAPQLYHTPIKDGIENLLTERIIKKAYLDPDTRLCFVVPNSQSKIPCCVRDDRKNELCEWVCRIGEPRDFVNFYVIFNMIEEFLESKK